MRWWYLRRAIPWTALLGCGATAVAAIGLLYRWPGAAPALLPAILACCAAASAFVFDERAATVVAVTPRGATWRRTARLAVGALPLGLWTLLVLRPPGELPLARPGWWLVGAATMVLTAGIAGAAARRELPAPGTALAPLVPIALFSPVVIALFLGWASIYPLGDFTTGITMFWLAVAGCGLVACMVALSPRLR